MKKISFYLLLTVALVFCLWLVLHQTTSVSKQPSSLQQSQQILPPKAGQPPTTNASRQAPVQETEFRRPPGIDDEGWKYLKIIRQLAFERNQPIEFHVRFINQYEQPVEGVKLDLTVTYLDEEMFRTTNFFHKKMGDEVASKSFGLASDSNGWIRLVGVRGYIVDMNNLSKEGYAGALPNVGSFGYQPGGKHLIGYAGMEDAFNPDKGYIIHLKKIEETHSAK